MTVEDLQNKYEHDTEMYELILDLHSCTPYSYEEIIEAIEKVEPVASQANLSRGELFEFMRRLFMR